MRETSIKIDNLSKCYKIGYTSHKGDGLRHILERAIRSPLDLNNYKTSRRMIEDFWAIKDLSLEIYRGEMIGIIGRNGAGKSTLLKLLSRITQPTYGSILLRGRVASLLEVGTGFHPELTGKENIFLNGAILGMTRNEIRCKFDEIASFAEIDKFIDTPVKRYSSGMYVRLAFAVAAHLDSEILIVDEVLAVGDAEFQKKCLSKMEDVTSNGGRTVILVSHQMPVIQNLCGRCILMDRGYLVEQGETTNIIKKYIENRSVLAEGGLCSRVDRSGHGDARITSIEMCDAFGRTINETMSGKDTVISLSYTVKDGICLNDCVFCVEICKDFKKYFSLSTALVDRKSINIKGNGKIEFMVPDWPLMGGRYTINVFVGSRDTIQDYLNDACAISVIDGDYYGTGKLHHEGWHGVSVLVKYSWKHH